MRELLSMAHRRQKEQRTLLIAQAALVWGIGELDAYSLNEFIRCGSLQVSKPDRLPPDLECDVDRKVAEILANGGLLIVPAEEPHSG